jgi:hypothetical protein
MPLVSDIPTIIFGADVTHPHPGEDLSPSIAAVSHYLPNPPPKAHTQICSVLVGYLLTLNFKMFMGYGFRV